MAPAVKKNVMLQAKITFFGTVHVRIRHQMHQKYSKKKGRTSGLHRKASARFLAVDDLSLPKNLQKKLS